jgi:ABC-2 type transport system permease protein
VEAVIDDQARLIRASQLVATETGLDFTDSYQQAQLTEASLPPITVQRTSLGEALFPPTLGQFDLGASQELILFMFLTGLTGSAALIQTRQLGVSRRMLSTATHPRTIVVGEVLGRYGVTLVQGLYILFATLIAFRVNWGDPLGAGAILLLFGAVSAGVAILFGTLFRNDQQAGGIGVITGLGLAALGGCMVPIEIFPPGMQRVAHITPHAWALDGFAELVRRNGSIADILPQLGVLAGYAAIVLALAAWRFRVVVTRSP